MAEFMTSLYDGGLMTTPLTVACEPVLFVGIISGVDCAGKGRLLMYSPTRRCLVNISLSVLLHVAGTALAL